MRRRWQARCSNAPGRGSQGDRMQAFRLLIEATPGRLQAGPSSALLTSLEHLGEQAGSHTEADLATFLEGPEPTADRP